MTLTENNIKCNNAKEKPFFDRQITDIIKGVSLIMMFVHHFFMFPHWWVADISYPYIEKNIVYLRLPTKLCVPVFAFLSGYFYYFTPYKTFAYSLKKITNLLLSYWLVFFPIVIALYLAGYRYNPRFFLKEMFALSFETMIFGWYVSFYFLSMFFLPLIVKVMPREIHLDILLCLIGIPYVLQVILSISNNYRLEVIEFLTGEMQRWFPNVLMGFIFANHKLFCKMDRLLEWLTYHRFFDIVVVIVMILLVPFGMNVMLGMTLTSTITKLTLIDIELNFYAIIAPMFIYFLVRLWNRIDDNKVKFVFASIGKYSMLMWFIHCIFFSNCKQRFQPILYFPKNPILVTIWGILLCYLCALPIDFISKRINGIKNRFLFQCNH